MYDSGMHIQYIAELFDASILVTWARTRRWSLTLERGGGTALLPVTVYLPVELLLHKQ